jgi:hypothetical protein
MWHGYVLSPCWSRCVLRFRQIVVGCWWLVLQMLRTNMMSSIKMDQEYQLSLRNCALNIIFRIRVSFGTFRLEYHRIHVQNSTLQILYSYHYWNRALCLVSTALGKGWKTLGKPLPSATLGKTISANFLTAKVTLPSVIFRALGKLFA